jgi:hypothetical protein
MPLAFGALILVSLSCAPPAPDLIGMDYEGWQRTTYIPLNYPIPGHLDKLREIYINPAANGVAITTVNGQRHFDYPAGTEVIKEIFASATPAPGEEPVQLTGMVKAPDDPRSRGGWIWVVRDLKSKTEQVITQEFCFTCHANANEGHPYGDQNPQGEYRDYLFYPWDPAKPPLDPAKASPAKASPEYNY